MKFKTRMIKGVEEVNGERLKRFKEKYDISCFIYKGNKEFFKNTKPVIKKHWYIVELQTGIAITGDDTKQEALNRFETWLQDKNNLKRLKELIEKKVEEWGVINNDELET